MIHQFERTINKLIEFGLFTDKEIIESQEFFLLIEKQDNESDYNKFIAEFNRITKKRYSGDIKSRELFYKALVNYSLEELIQCTEDAMKNPYFLNDRPDIVKPDWILKKENL
ncbi:MAG: hypothetical protein JXR68_02755, partial [Bacteroidales bacterium]|nr:hypothetical protein [Bacteroidales bacterium]